MKDRRGVASKLRSRSSLIHEPQVFVANLAVEIARAIGVADRRLDGIRVCALLHDVGELTIPRAVLATPGPLSRAELATVRTHCAAGRDLLKDLPYSCPAARVAFEHHERLDGSGYPRGLKGEEISLEARIVAVADVAEAMTAERPYRPALGLDAALEELWKWRGVRYDGEVVDACSHLLGSSNFIDRWHTITEAVPRAP